MKMRLIKDILFLLCAIVNFLFLYSEKKLSPVTVIEAVIFFSVASVIHLTVHELGHFTGGRISGYKLVCLQIGPVNVIADNSDKLSLSMKETHGGQCIMAPDHSSVIHFKMYNLGGILANIIICLLGIFLLSADSFYLKFFLIELVFTGLVKITANLIPHLSNSIPNDGYVVKLLERDPAVQKDYRMYLSLYAALFWKEKICADDYKYQREVTSNDEELLYYNEIQDLLKTLEDI